MKRGLLAVLLIGIIVADPAWAAVALTGTAGCQDLASATSHTFSYTVAADADALVVGITFIGFPLPVVSSVTYAGAALTFVNGVTENGVSRGEIWRRVAPATGANNVVVTFDVTTVLGSAQQGFKGVDQATPVSNSAINSGTSGTPTVTVTSAVGEWTMSQGQADSVFTGPNQTQLCNSGDFTNTASEEAAGAASVVHSWTNTSAEWVMVAVSLKAAAGGGVPGGGTTPLRSLLGVGQ